MQQNCLDQTVEPGPPGGGHFHILRLAAHLLDHDLVAEQLGADAVRIGVRLVHLVDRYDDRRIRRLGVANCLNGLRHHAIIGRYNQHDDIGDAGAARPHRGERLVTRGVDKGHARAVGQLHLVGANMLGDPARLVRRDIGRTQRIQQARLAVIDVTHDGHHGWPLHQFLRGVSGPL